VRMNRIAVCTSQETREATDIPADVRDKMLEFMRE